MSRALPIGIGASLLLLACNRAPSETTNAETAKRARDDAAARAISADASKRPAASKPVETNPAALMPGALGVTSEEVPETEVKRPVLAIKSRGRAGEWLEGDVYMFRLVSTEVCGDPVKSSRSAAPAAAVTPGGAATPESGTVPATVSASRAVVGAKVEIRAKAKMTVSPRDVSLSKGGVSFDGSVDPERRLKGCTPLLKISRLNQNEVATGYVLFDLPSAELKTLEMTYQPTRWGGAGQVRVTLAK